MRRLALPLLLALSSLAFAPAPLPRQGREARWRSQERLVAECRRRLDELGVRWRLERGDGWRSVRYAVAHPSGGSSIGGVFYVDGGDLAAALRAVISEAEVYLAGKRAAQ